MDNESETFALSELAAELAEHAKPMLRDYPLTLEIDCAPDIGSMRANRRYVFQILQ